MAKRRTKRILITVAGLLFIVSVLSFVIGVQKSMTAFTVYGKVVYLPAYFVAECLPRAENMQLKVVASHTDNPTFYHCRSESTGTWVPGVNGVQCEYSIDDYSNLNSYDCKGYTESINDLKDPNKCRKTETTWSIQQGVATHSISTGDTIYINTDKVIGNAKLSVRYPAYGLTTQQHPSGYKSPQQQSCLINELSNIEADYGKELHTIDAKDKIAVIPGVPLNMVSGLTPAVTKQMQIIPELEGGTPIYIYAPGCYYKTAKAEDGFLYVATEQGENCGIKRIECIPGTPLCSDDARKIQKITEQSCDKYGGALTGYSPLQGDNSQLCKYSCVAGKLKETTDCIKIETNCPDNKPIWDTKTGECTSLPIEDSCPEGTHKVTETTSSWFGLVSETKDTCAKDTSWLIWILVGAAALVLAYVLSRSSKSQYSGGI